MTMRPYSTSRRLLAVCLLFLATCPLPAQEPVAVTTPDLVASDPAARWVSVYGWMQTGDRLGAAGHWALAMGSYIESHRQIRELAVAHPTFETELVAYRTGKLAETIETVDARLSEDEHETMMTYLDFIESLELGLEQRFSNQYEAALGTLDIARSLLDALIGKKPPEFREAIDSQYQRLEDNILWLGSQIDYKEASRRRPVTSAANDGRDRGTTRFVKTEDLPDSSDGVIVSGMLFPSTDLPPPEKEAKEQTEAGSAPERPMRFRMNSRQDTAGPSDEEEPGEAVEEEKERER